ncbi:RagB/SusD family nutrient uptake outer membrane protein [Tenacibaculum sp. TC6]|uniref:RagB/SusD family nutrient uptake outer membrane protein n=1 Tax=Tenacibaculum sp. TC6 TaxID=3423223 RepID=UPI003D36085C
MKKNIIHTISIIVFTLFISCSDYLEKLPSNVITPSQTTDYDEMLNSFSLFRSMPDEYIYLSDASSLYFAQQPFGAKENAFFWEVDLMYSYGNSPNLWNVPYSKIYTYNVVIDGVMSSEGGSESKKKEILAEAKLGKAFELFYLANTFCKQYDIATASNDPGIPLVYSIDVAEPIPGRGTLQETYDFIIESLQQAIPNLPMNNTDRFRGSKLAAYGLLARIYYYMSNYEEAEKYAEEVLKINNTIVDLNTVTNYADYQIKDNPEEIYIRVISGGANGPQVALASNHINLYNTQDDLRFFNRNYIINIFGGYENFRELNFGISVQEMIFIAAEAKTRKNELSDALILINNFLRTRIDNTVYTDFTSTNQEEVLNWVLAERRKELYFRGLRWFDMRKLSKEGKMPNLTREYTNFNTGVTTTYTLEGNSKKYTLLIPEVVMSFNPDMPQNER